MCDSNHWWKLQSCCSPVQFSSYQFTGAAFSISLYIVTVSTLLHYCDHSSLGHGSVYTPLCSSLTGWLSSAPARPAQSLPTLARAAGLCPAWPGELDLAPGAATNTDKFRHIIWRLSVIITALISGNYQVIWTRVSPWQSYCQFRMSAQCPTLEKLYVNLCLVSAPDPEPALATQSCVQCLVPGNITDKMSASDWSSQWNTGLWLVRETGSLLRVRQLSPRQSVALLRARNNKQERGEPRLGSAYH